jgi:hypothetical protein
VNNRYQAPEVSQLINLLYLFGRLPSRGKLNGGFDMEKKMQEILEQQGMPFDYTGDIQTLMEKDDHVLMNATFVFMFGRIIGIREEREKRRGTRA